MVRLISELRCSDNLLIGIRETVKKELGSFEKEMQKDLNELNFKSKMAEIEKHSQSQAGQGFMSKQYDGIKMTVDNLLTEGRSLEKNMNYPTRRLKMLKN